MGLNMKVLLVRLSSMGDLIHTLPAIEDLSHACPNVELHWLCETNFSDIACLHPFVKKVHTMSWRSWRKALLRGETWRAIAELKRTLQSEQYDFVLDSQGLLKSVAFAKFAGKSVFGFDRNSIREPLASMFYDKTFAVDKHKHVVWRNRTLFANAFHYSLPSTLCFGATVPDEGILPDLLQPYYVACHATSRDGKLWDIDAWIQWANLVHQHHQAWIYLPWGNESERLRAERMAQSLPFARVCPKMTLLQAAYLLQNAQGVVGVDTGLLHLANALNVPVVGVYTDSDPKKAGVQESPWSRNVGGIAQMPSAQTVFTLLMECVQAKAEQ